MPSISLCMIVKNEEETLPRCLDSVQDIVDEIVIVDTGSTDRTKDIAARYTGKVFDFAWIDDFSSARNYSFSLASKDYIFWLDADDVLLPEDAAKFSDLKASLDPAVDVVMMRYNTGFDADGRVTFSYFRERLSRRSKGFLWHEPVHEHLEMGGSIIYSDICITHQKTRVSVPGRNLAIYENILSQGGHLSPRGLYYFARELKDSGRYVDAATHFTRFLDGGQGWVEDNISACIELAACTAALGDAKVALKALLRSFEYDTPRAEVCCALGYHYKAKGDYRSAAFWFGLALGLDEPQGNLGFTRADCHSYIPCIELAVCYDKLGQSDKAIEYNERAGAFKPGDASVLYNRNYFNSLQR